MVAKDASQELAENLKREISAENIDQLETRLMKIEDELREYKNRYKFAQDEHEFAEKALQEAEAELLDSEKVLNTYKGRLYDVEKKVIVERINELKNR